MRLKPLVEKGRILLLGATLICYLLMTPFLSGTLTNVIYGYLTGNWAPLVGGLASLGISFTVSAASAAAAGATSWTAAAAAIASALGPVGWGVIFGILAGL